MPKNSPLPYINKKESEVTLAPHFLKNLFTKSAPFEEALAKDISEFTLSEIIEFYKYIDQYERSDAQDLCVSPDLCL